MASVRHVSQPEVGQVLGLSDALLEHFERTPIGMILLRGDRRILAANEALAALAGINMAILPGSFLRRFLWSEQANDLEDRIFEEVDRDGHWTGEVEFRSSLGNSSPMMLAIT